MAPHQCLVDTVLGTLPNAVIVSTASSRALRIAWGRGLHHNLIFDGEDPFMLEKIGGRAPLAGVTLETALEEVESER